MKNHKITKSLLAIPLLISMSACVSVYSSVPLSRLESAETLGEQNRVMLKGGYQRVHNITFARDASSRPITLSTTNFAVSDDLMGGADYEILKRLDLSLRGDLAQNQPWMLGAKYQFFGEPYLTSAEGGFSASVMVAGGSSTQNRGGSQNGVFGRGGYNWDSNLTTTSQDYSLIVGYRLKNSMLLYASVFRGNYYYGGSIHQKQSDDGLSPASQAFFGADGTLNGWNLALQLDPTERKQRSGFFTIEVVHSNFEIRNPDVAGLDNYALNLNLGLRF